MSFSMKCAGVFVVAFSMLAIASPNNTAQGAEEAGAFQACYRCGTGLPGAPTLTVQWVVSTPNQTVNGVGTITQAVNPPLLLHVNMQGHYQKLEGKELEVVSYGGMPGGAVQLVLLLPEGWGKPGKAYFKWYGNNRHGESGGMVPAAPCK